MRTLITNGTIVTAEGSSAADILVDGETIATIGAGLAAAGVTADETIDATGRYVIPGGIDVHTHMELPFGGTFAKDTFETGTRAAAFGGTTSIVDFAVQSRGASLRAGLDAWHAKAEGNAVADYGFHMIMSDVNDDTLAEMDGLVAEGVPDFKLFTAYPGVFYSDDGAIFRAMQQTAKNGGLIMMHAENGMAIDVVAAQTVDAGTTDPIGHGLARKADLRGRGDQPGHPPRRGGRRARLHRPPLGEGGAGRGPRRPRPRLEGVRRDLPAVPVPLARRPRARVRGREVRVLAAAAHGGPPGRPLERARQGRPADRLDRPLPVRLPRPEGAGRAATSARSPTACPASRTGSTCSTTAASSPAGSPASAGSRSSRRRRRSCSGCTRRRARSRSARMPTSWSTTRPAAHTISATTHHMDVDYSCYEGRTVQGGSDVVLSRGTVIVRDGSSPAARATAGSSSARRPTTRGWPERDRRPDFERRSGSRPISAARRGPGGRPGRRGERDAPADIVDDLVQAVDEAATTRSSTDTRASRAGSTWPLT